MADAVRRCARSEIGADEELTIDHALFKADDRGAGRFASRCGSPNCRGRGTGRDWRLPGLQARCHGHFSALLNRHIARLQQRVASPPEADPAAPAAER
jgi:hypothetical protein